MSKFFWSIIFIWFDFRLIIGPFKFNFLADFIGYILLFLGLKKFQKHSKHFNDIYILSIFLVIVNIVFEFCEFVYLDINYIYINILIIISLLWVWYKIISGIKDIENKEERDYFTKSLFYGYVFLIFISGCSLFIKYMPNDLAYYVGIFQIISIIFYLVLLFRTIKEYNSYH